MATQVKYSMNATKEKKDNYFREVQREFFKVTWTTKEEMIVFTKVVVGSTFAFALAIYATDMTIKSVLDGLGFVVRWITG
jgi:preprotein translocase subunit SecE